MILTNKALTIIYVVIGLFLTSIIALWLFGETWFDEEHEILLLWLQAILVMAALALSMICLLYLGSVYKIATLAGKAWALLGIGMACWLFGEIIYVYLNLILEIDPFPTLADVLYLGGYIPLFTGLVMHARLIKLPLTTGSKALVIAGTAITGTFILLAAIVYPLILEWPVPEEDVLAWIIVSMYPVLDIVLVACVLIVAVKLRKGSINVAWALLLVGMIVTVGADTLYNWQSSVGIEERVFQYYDLLFIISYTMIFMAGLKVINLMRKSF